MMRMQAGFTLVELLIAVVVTGIVTLTVTDFTMRSLQTSAEAQNRYDLTSELQLTLDKVSLDVRLSADADQNNRNPDNHSPGGSDNLLGWSSDADTLVLATAATDANHQMLFSDAANYITVKNNIVYYLSNGTLYRRTIAADVSGNSTQTSCPANLASSSCPADKELLHNVTDFQITYLDGDNATVAPADARSVRIGLTARKDQSHTSVSASYTTRMVFRNY